MRKIFLVLFVIYATTLSVKADDQKPTVTKKLFYVDVLHKGSDVILEEMYEVVTKYPIPNDISSKKGYIMHDNSVTYTQPFGYLFHLKKDIPDNILKQAYFAYKGGTEMPFTNLKRILTKTYYKNYYLTRVNEYSDYQVVFNKIDENNTNIDVKMATASSENTMSLLLFSLLLPCFFYGVIIGLGDEGRMTTFHHRKERWARIGILIMLILLLFNFATLVFDDTYGEWLSFSFNFIGFILFASSKTDDAHDKRQESTLVILSWIGSFCVILGAYITFFFYYKDLFVPSVLLVIFLSSVLVTYVINNWEEIRISIARIKLRKYRASTKTF